MDCNIAEVVSLGHLDGNSNKMPSCMRFHSSPINLAEMRLGASLEMRKPKYRVMKRLLTYTHPEMSLGVGPVPCCLSQYSSHHSVRIGHKLKMLAVGMIETSHLYIGSLLCFLSSFVIFSSLEMK